MFNIYEKYVIGNLIRFSASFPSKIGFSATFHDGTFVTGDGYGGHSGTEPFEAFTINSYALLGSSPFFA